MGEQAKQNRSLGATAETDARLQDTQMKEHTISGVLQTPSKEHCS
jgi:hypothetical protein